MPYLWLKAAHVAAVLIFVGGLLVQAFAVGAGTRGELGTVHLVSRWDQRVTVPALLAVWLSGVVVAVSGGWFPSHWLWVKLVFVVALSGLHGVQSGRLRRLRHGAQFKSDNGPLRIAPAILVLVTVIAVLAVTKPF